MLRHNNCKIDTIMIHCTATPPRREVSRAELDRWHKAERFEPYTDPNGKVTYAGYHLLVHLDGSFELLRPDLHRGQHCPQENMNNRAVAVCYVGGVDNNNQPCDTRTEAQKRTLLTLVRTLKGRYPNAQIVGHRDYAAKACPSFDAKREYKEV
ncbi:MAG: N-acetylmuramoyl-L-alanine amidase [Muribaculaceae bacterium]|nr:N-acetylmuramoyl-L-alanine amidase [Muribaculaceae bacterium]